MTHQRTLTAAHWGVYEVEYDDNGKATRLHPFSKDPDPSPIGLHMLSDEVTRLRVRRPAVRKSWLEKGPGAAPEKRGQEAFVEVEWNEALDLVAKELRRVKDTHSNRAIFGGLLWLVERRPLPSCAEPGPPLPEFGRRLCAPPGFLQPWCGARADAAHRGADGRADVDAHAVGRHGRALQALRLLRRRAVQEQPDQRRRRHQASRQGRALRHARQGRALRQRDADGGRSRYRRRRRVAGDPAQHRHRPDPGALPYADGGEPARSRLPRPLHRGLRQVRALARRQGRRLGREDHRHSRSAHHLTGARDGGDPHHGQHQLVAAAQPSRRAAVLGDGHARLHAGPGRPAGRRLRRRLRPGQPDGQRVSQVQRPDPAAGHQRGERLHPGRALHRHAAAAGRHGGVQRPRPRLSRHPAGLLGGRQSVPSSPGPQPADAGLAQARDHRVPRAVLDAGRAARRHRAARHHQRWSATTSATAAASPT